MDSWKKIFYYYCWSEHQQGVAILDQACPPCCRAASVLPPWNSLCKIELIFGVMLQFSVVWCIHSRPEIVLTIQSDNGKQGYKVGGKNYCPKVVPFPAALAADMAATGFGDARNPELAAWPVPPPSTSDMSVLPTALIFEHLYHLSKLASTLETFNALQPLWVDSRDVQTVASTTVSITSRSHSFSGFVYFVVTGCSFQLMSW